MIQQICVRDVGVRFVGKAWTVSVALWALICLFTSFRYFFFILKGNRVRRSAQQRNLEMMFINKWDFKRGKSQVLTVQHHFSLPSSTFCPFKGCGEGCVWMSCNPMAGPYLSIWGWVSSSRVPRCHSEGVLAPPTPTRIPSMFCPCWRLNPDLRPLCSSLMASSQYVSMAKHLKNKNQMGLFLFISCDCEGSCSIITAMLKRLIKIWGKDVGWKRI